MFYHQDVTVQERENNFLCSVSLKKQAANFICCSFKSYLYLKGKETIKSSVKKSDKRLTNEMKWH